MSFEPKDVCAEHDCLQEDRRQRVADFIKRFETLEARCTALERNSVDRTTFWSVVAVVAAIIGFLFVTDIGTNEKVSEIKSHYVTRYEMTEWKNERERRLAEWVENIRLEMANKEDRHSGKAEPR